MQRHDTPLSLSALANTPGQTRRPVDAYRESMDPRVRKDTAPVHWRLDEHQTSGFLQNLFSDTRVFANANTNFDAIFKHLQAKGLWSDAESRWKPYPSTDARSEENVAEFFNKILHNIPDNIRCQRRWTGNGANKPLNGFPGATRKPDLILCERSIIEKCEIRQHRPFDLRTDVYVIGEVKKKNTNENLKASFIELAGKVVFLLETQDGRYATPGIRLLGEDIILTLFDRGGSISTHPLNVHEHPQLFLRILLGIAFGDAVMLGFDPTISPVINGQKSIQILKDGNQVIVSVDQLLFISASLHGRGTTVWSGTITGYFPGVTPGETVVVKDSFVDPLRRYTEGKILKILEDHGVEGVPRLIHEQQVQTTHPLDPHLRINQSTHILRSLAADSIPEDCKYHLRVLSRLLSSPKGDPIFDFSSLAELLVGLIDCLMAHRDALEKAGVLHRDISLFNLLFRILAPGQKGRLDFLQVLDGDIRAQLEQKITEQLDRRGLLADWGYAIANQDRPTDLVAEELVPNSNILPTLYVKSHGDTKTVMKPQTRLKCKDNIIIPLVDNSLPNDSSAPIDACPLHRTGTWAWMAAELSHKMPGTPIIHRAYHDLESFFYILVAICLLYDTPRTAKSPDQLAECFDPLFAVTQPSIHKTLTIQSELGWTALILPHISPYFQPLIPLLQDLRKVLILPIKLENGGVQNNTNFTHQTFINALVEALARVPDSSWIPFDSEGAVAANSQNNPPITMPGAILSEETLARPSPLRMTGTSSGSNSMKRPLDNESNESRTRGRKRTHLNTQPADTDSPVVPHSLAALNPGLRNRTFQVLRNFSSAPQ